DPVGLRMCHEAQSLHLHYGLDLALSTLNSCRHLHELKTRFPVGRLIPLSGTGISPAESARLSLAHRKTFPHQDLPPSDNPRRYTAAPWPPPDAPNAADETRDGARKTSRPTCLAEPASPLAGRIDPAPSECPAFSLLPPVWLFPLVSPAAVYRFRSATVPESLASAASGSPATPTLSCPRFPDSPCWPSLLVMPAG